MHPSQMPAFTSKDKWQLEVSKNKKQKQKTKTKNKKQKILMKRGILRYSKDLEKLYFRSENALFA